MASSDNKKMDRSIHFFGLLTMGIGCMFGTSWLLLTAGWLDRAGGPMNVILALVLCLIVEIPLAFAYLEAIPMFPLSGGEMVYSYMGMGPLGGLMAAWSGIIMNGVIVCWETISIYKVCGYLFPSLENAPALYELLGFPVTLPGIILGVALAVIIILVQLSGTTFVSSMSKVLTSAIVILTLAGILVGLFHFDAATFAVPATKSPITGSFSLLAVLTFTIAGWETVAKSAGEARGEVARKKSGLALVMCLLICITLNALVVIAVSGLLPWPEASTMVAPFIDGLQKATGSSVFGKVLLIAALIGIVGVSNSTMFGATRLMYGLADVGLIPKSFTKLNKNRVPVRCILVVGAFAIATPFLGKGVFLPLIDVTAVATIVMWVMTFFSVLLMRKKYPDMERPVRMPGGQFMVIFGIICSIIILGTVLIPTSPGAIIWPSEYIVTIVLYALGLILYLRRDKSLTYEEQRKMIIGETEIDEPAQKPTE